MLIFRLKKEWWDKVISGEKTHEYREVGQYWGVRLFNESQKYNGKGGIPCMFTLGYPKQNDKSRIRHAKIKQVEIKFTGLGTDLAVPGPVYDITFELEE